MKTGNRTRIKHATFQRSAKGQDKEREYVCGAVYFNIRLRMLYSILP